MRRRSGVHLQKGYRYKQSALCTRKVSSRSRHEDDPCALPAGTYGGVLCVAHRPTHGRVSLPQRRVEGVAALCCARLWLCGGSAHFRGCRARGTRFIAPVSSTSSLAHARIHSALPRSSSAESWQPCRSVARRPCAPRGVSRFIIRSIPHFPEPYGQHAPRAWAPTPGQSQGRVARLMLGLRL